MDKLAEKLNISKTEVYREAIRDIGGVSTTGCFRIAEAEVEKRVWTSRGLGWQVDTLPAKTDGWIYLIKYYGSSEYNGAQMARLIDHVIQDCEAVGIPTMTEEQVTRLVGAWAKKKENENENKVDQGCA